MGIKKEKLEKKKQSVKSLRWRHVNDSAKELGSEGRSDKKMKECNDMWVSRQLERKGRINGFMKS